MRVLSLFDGISCGRLALERAGIKVEKYYASEIDKHAIQISHKNFPDIEQIGDVQEVNGATLGHIDLVIGGSPCQGFSFIGKQLNFEDSRSKLFFEFVRVLKEVREVNPNVKFLLENVRMKKQSLNTISEYMHVNPVYICSSNFSAQKRKRYYWTNITEMEDMKPTVNGVLMKNILEKVQEDVSLYLSESQIERGIRKYAAQTWKSGNRMGNMTWPDITERKAKTITATQIVADRSVNHIHDGIGIRRLSPIECERLQNLPDNFTEGIGKSKRYHVIGNGWNVNTIQYIFSKLKV
jgi:DNA-cytosine methyltransferase